MAVRQVSTLSDVGYRSRNAPGKWLQRAGLSVLLCVVVLGAIGIFGVHSRTTAATGDGYSLRITYPQVARAGQDIPWRARIHHTGAITGDITLAISAGYLRLFEIQGYAPDLTDSTSDGRYVYLTFSPPPTGNDFMVDIDAHIKPSSQLGKSATVKLRVGGRDIVSTKIRTWLVP